MAHDFSEKGEKILDTEFQVLDKGFVRLVDYMGSDSRIVQAARVSYGEGTKSYREDKGLINYLLRNEHTSPFEQVVFTFHVKLPIFVARQWVRHRTGRLNEISGRYSIMKHEFYKPDAADIAYQSTDNKQGRSSDTEMPQHEKDAFLQSVEESHKRAGKEYDTYIENGISREIARINLPLSLYTEWYWQMDLHNLFHFLKLRMDPHAQLEIRRYAETIFSIIKNICPIACAAFEEHVLTSAKLSNKELSAVEILLNGGNHGLSEKELTRLKQKISTAGLSAST